MAEVTLQGEIRRETGKGVARKLRAQGRIPGILYGRGIEPVALSVDQRSLAHSLATDARSNVLIDLHVDGDTHLTLARVVDRNPVRGDILHVDFLKISRDQKITVDVPIHVQGESRGVKEGGVLEHHLWQLHVECSPASLPDRISVDISALGVGDSIHVRDLTPPPGATLLTSPDEIIVAVVVPQALKVEAELEAAPTEVEGAPAEAPPAGEQPAE